MIDQSLVDKIHALELQKRLDAVTQILTDFPIDKNPDMAMVFMNWEKTIPCSNRASVEHQQV